VDWVRLPGTDLLLVNNRSVYAFQILDAHLSTLEHELGVSSPDACLVPTMWVQVYVGKDATHRIFPTDDYRFFSCGKLNVCVRVLDD
jgi:hypothetical protein